MAAGGFWDDKDEMIKVTPDIAVYNDVEGNLVIRERSSWNEQDDTLIVIPVDCGPRMIAALLQILKEQEHQSVTVLQPGADGKGTETVIRLPFIPQPEL
jgi:hypothetical protein